MGRQDRIVLDNVDRYRVMEPLFEGVRVVLSYRGERTSPAYVQGISGAAFRIGGICPCAPTCTAAMETQDLPRIFGYAVEALPFEEDDASEARGAEIIARVKDEIRAGRPALVWHAFTMLEWDVVAGLDEVEHKFLGRGSYAGLEDYAVEDQMRLITERPALGAILIGEKVGAFDARAAEVAALEEAVKHAHTRKEDPSPTGEWVFLEGIQCYDRWVDDVQAHPQSTASLGSRYCYGIYRSTRRAAAEFLQELSAKVPEARLALSHAAGAFAAEADALDVCMPYLGWQAPGELDADATRQAHQLLSQARDAYVRGIEEVGLALDAMK